VLGTPVGSVECEYPNPISAKTVNRVTGAYSAPNKPVAPAPHRDSLVEIEVGPEAPECE
jgi:hypothetical protein